MAKKMTRRMGEAFAKKVAKLYGVEGDEYGPKVNDAWFGDRLIIGWEGGPEDSHGCPWSYDCSGKLQELAPKGWFVEAVNHWAVALYPI